jgi:hypothetical protein
MLPKHTPLLIDFFLTARPLKPARELLVFHQRPRITQNVWVEVIPDFVLGVDFSLACMRLVVNDVLRSIALRVRIHLPG